MAIRRIGMVGWWAALSLGITGSMGLAAGYDPGAPRPNVVFILSDDQGYGDFGAFFQNSRAPGQATLSTPRLDQMTAEGMMLRQHYTSAPVCAPARASLLLGQHQGHCPVRDNQFDKALPDNHTLATVLEAAGYHTGCIGKWGLQGSSASGYPGHPLRHGFQEFFGFLPHNAGHTYYHDSSKPLMEDWTDVTAAYTDIYSTDLFTARAKKFVADHVATNAAQPFFLYLAYTAIHNPLHIPGGAYPAGAGRDGGLQWPLSPTPTTRDTWRHPDYAGATYDHDNNPGTAEIAWTDNMKRYATMMRRLDDGVGDLLELLHDLNLHTNTLVVFTSDNGPANENGGDPRNFDSWGPLDGFKRDVWEGGVRVPTVAWWPGQIAGATVNDFPSGFWDWLPTFAELAGVPPPASTDGVSLLPSLTRSGVQRSRGYLYLEYFSNSSNAASADVFARKNVTGRGQQQIIRVGDLVGIRTQIASHSDPLRLYNVMADPHQDQDLSGFSTNAALLAQMKNLLLTVRRPEPSAARPYDNELLPAAGWLPLTNGALEYSAFAGDWSWLPDLEALTPTATGQVAGFDLSVRPRDDHFGLKFSGYLRVPADGEYTFWIRSDAGASLWLHDARVIDDDFGHDGSERSGVVLLKAGWHPIRVFYRHATGTRTLDLEYAGPGMARQPIPSSVLYAPGVASSQPMAFDDSATIRQNTVATIAVLANDFDDGVPGALDIQSVTAPMAGTAVANRGQIVYTPAAGFLGEDEFSYTITDGEFADSAKVRVKVYFDDGSLWFPFNQVTGLATEDAGGGFAATLQGFAGDGTTWVTGRVNRAIQFDGSDDRLTVAGFPGVLGGNPRTIAAWVKTTAAQSQAIVGWGVRSAGAKWSTILNAEGNVRQEVESGYAYGTTVVNDGAWHHVAVVLGNDGSPNVTEVKFYVDGQPDPISAQSARAIDTGDGGDLMIGLDNQNRYFTGAIDEVRLFNRALSAAEVAALAGATQSAAEAWHRRYFGNAAVNWSADDDGDGLPRLAEYALGLPPLIGNGARPWLKPAIANGRLQIRFPRRAPGTHDLNYTVNVSRDLVDWSALTAAERTPSLLTERPGFEEAVYEALPTTAQEPRLYIRLQTGFR